MKFFTPDLYLRFNSPDDAEADRADAEWEDAIRRYRGHLEGLRDRMPSPVCRLAELCLHDAEVLAREQQIEPFFPVAPSEPFPFPSWFGFAIVSLRQDGAIVSLIYSLWDRVRERPADETWPFSKDRPRWLYDEIDLVTPERGLFLHRVLLSDGCVLEVPFLSVLIHGIPLHEGEPGGATRQSA